MPKTFTRIVSFKIEGEIYDNETTPEELIKNYTWKFKGFHDSHEDKCFLESSHDDHHGRITKMTRQIFISKTDKEDTEISLI
jgi:hypothetical protein